MKLSTILLYLMSVIPFSWHASGSFVADHLKTSYFPLASSLMTLSGFRIGVFQPYQKVFCLLISDVNHANWSAFYWLIHIFNKTYDLMRHGLSKWINWYALMRIIIRLQYLYLSGSSQVFYLDARAILWYPWFLCLVMFTSRSCSWYLSPILHCL